VRFPETRLLKEEFMPRFVALAPGFHPGARFKTIMPIKLRGRIKDITR
jgi:hypothetical protein